MGKMEYYSGKENIVDMYLEWKKIHCIHSGATHLYASN